MPNVNPQVPAGPVFEPKQPPAPPTGQDTLPELCEPLLLAIAPADSLNQEASLLGKAQPILSLNTEVAIDQWKEAGKGEKLKLTPKAGAGLGHLTALMEHVRGTPSLSKEQKSQIGVFLREYAAHFGKTPAEQSSGLRLLNERLEKHGITREQLHLIGDGKFTAKDMLTMIRTGEGPGLMGKFPGGGSLQGPSTVVFDSIPASVPRSPFKDAN